MTQPDADTVRDLLRTECPEYAECPVLLVDGGWDNFTFRVGKRFAVRLPRREATVPLLLNEQRWLPLLAKRLPVAVPVPLHAGRPCDRFPRPWSVVPWISGVTAEDHRFATPDALLLAEALHALHRAAPEDAPANPFRGVPLEVRREAVEQRLQRLRGHAGVNAERLAAIWREACSGPAETERRWLHGDLHPRNVVVRHGSLVGLIDWGDLCGGDVATDLACGWTLIDTAAARAEFLRAYGATPAMAVRAVGWAIHMGSALAESGDSRHVEIGLATLDRVGTDR